MDNQQIERIIRRTQRAWYEDGIWEIGFSLALLIISLYYWLVVWFDLGARLGLWLPLVQIGVFLLAFLPVRWVVAGLKQRFAFPRTGYVAFRRKDRRNIGRRIVIGAGTGILVSALVVVLSLTGNLKAVVPVVIGLVLGLSMLYLSMRFGIARFAVSGALTFGLGLAVAFLRPDDTSGAALLLTGFGALNLLLGCIALWMFVRRNPVSQADSGLEDA